MAKSVSAAVYALLVFVTVFALWYVLLVPSEGGDTAKSVDKKFEMIELADRTFNVTLSKQNPPYEIRDDDSFHEWYVSKDSYHQIRKNITESENFVICNEFVDEHFGAEMDVEKKNVSKVKETVLTDYRDRPEYKALKHLHPNSTIRLEKEGMELTSGDRGDERDYEEFVEERRGVDWTMRSLEAAHTVKYRHVALNGTDVGLGSLTWRCGRGSDYDSSYDLDVFESLHDRANSTEEFWRTIDDLGIDRNEVDFNAEK